MMKHIGALSRIFLLSYVWFSAASWAGAEDAVQQMLPLAVGNTWHYKHVFRDTTINASYLEQYATISITHTEDIGGYTYYVFSDMPYEEPPVPYFFVAGKKVRWEGDHLLFRQQDRDVALYQFGDQEFYNYPISETNSDTLVFGKNIHISDQYDWLPGWPTKANCVVRDAYSIFVFSFTGHKWHHPWVDTQHRQYHTGRSAVFLKNFGMVNCGIGVMDSQGNPIGGSGLITRKAIINGVPWGFWNDSTGKASASSGELPCLPTSVGVSSWGVLKQQFTCPDCDG